MPPPPSPATWASPWAALRLSVSSVQGDTARPTPRFWGAMGQGHCTPAQCPEHGGVPGTACPASPGILAPCWVGNRDPGGHQGRPCWDVCRSECDGDPEEEGAEERRPGPGVVLTWCLGPGLPRKAVWPAMVPRCRVCRTPSCSNWAMSFRGSQGLWLGGSRECGLAGVVSPTVRGPLPAQPSASHQRWSPQGSDHSLPP